MAERHTVNQHLPLSLASSFYWRVLRRRLPAVLIEACTANPKTISFRPFTLIFEKQRIPAGQLAAASAAVWKNQLRNILVSAGIEDADGYLFACLHGSFDGEDFEPHFHGFATGVKALLLDVLRIHPDLKRSFLVKNPVQIGTSISTSDAENLVRWLTYCIKSFWPWKPYWIGADGKRRRAKQGRRLPRPQELEFLSWMARQNLGDLVLLMGLRLSDLSKRRMKK